MSTDEPIATDANHDDNDHLRYLLTAYLFDNLSDAGRAEVEAHLEECALCRTELAELRATRELLQDALVSPTGEAEPYAFDARRRKRVLDAARKGRPRRFPRVLLGVAAVILLCALLAALVRPMITAERRHAGHDMSTAGSHGSLEMSLADTMNGKPAARPPNVAASKAEFPKAAFYRAPALKNDETRVAGGTPGSHGDPLDNPQSFKAVIRQDEMPDWARAVDYQRRLKETEIAQREGKDAELRAVSEQREELQDDEDAPEVISFYGSEHKRKNKKRAGQRRPSGPAKPADDATPSGMPDGLRILNWGSRAKDDTTLVNGWQSTLSGIFAPTERTEEANRGSIDVLKELDEIGAEFVESPVFDDGGTLGVVPDFVQDLAGPTILVVDEDLDVTIGGGGSGGGAGLPFRSATRGDRATATGEEEQGAGSVDGDGYGRFEPNPTGRWDTSESGVALGKVNSGPTLGQLRAAEETRRAVQHFQKQDPSLSAETVVARGLTIPPPAVGDEGLGREGFRQRYGVNPFVDTARDRFSTFAMDVDTASYTRTRELLRNGQLPDPATVRVEEFVNYFRATRAADPERAFSVFCEGGPSRFGNDVELLEVTVKARELAAAERRPLALTLAIDTSGSMALEDRLAQVTTTVSTLLGSLEPRDRIAVVAYGAQAYLALPPTPARERDRIRSALASLHAGGSTNVEAGLELAYRLADDGYDSHTLNRVILCSDGVATEGARDASELLEVVRVYAKRGIYLSVLGFGRERYDDAFLERLADEGNGNYAYVDGPAEARRVLRQNLPATLHVLARDAKIQVEFDPQVVGHYRLLGYENRDIRDQDFRNDSVDAGEVGPGSTVTALYEVRRHPGATGALGRVFIRFHDTRRQRVVELDFPIPPGVLAASPDRLGDRHRFMACVAETAELLRESYWARDGSYARVLAELYRLSPEFRRTGDWRELHDLVSVAGRLTFEKLSTPRKEP